MLFVMLPSSTGGFQDEKIPYVPDLPFHEHCIVILGEGFLGGSIHPNCAKCRKRGKSEEQFSIPPPAALSFHSAVKCLLSTFCGLGICSGGWVMVNMMEKPSPEDI